MEKQTGSEKRKTKKQLSPAGSFFAKLFLIAVVFCLLHVFVFGSTRISGNAMYPSLRDGDFCVFYKLEAYHVGDLVSYEDPSGGKHVGRIVAMDGSFDISEGNIPMLNGMELSEEVVYETPKGSYPLPAEIEPGQYWIMNDFRSDTADSRDFGPIDEKDLHGKVMFLFRRRSF